MVYLSWNFDIRSPFGMETVGRWNPWQRRLKLSAGFEVGELGTHKGRPYWPVGAFLPLRGVWLVGAFEGGPGHPQGVPLRGDLAGLGAHEGCPCGECDAVCVGPGGALRCVACAGSRWVRATTGVGGSTVAAGRQGHIATHSLRREVLGGALRGRSPRTREGRIGPTAQKTSGQWSETPKDPVEH